MEIQNAKTDALGAAWILVCRAENNRGLTPIILLFFTKCAIAHTKLPIEHKLIIAY